MGTPHTVAQFFAGKSAADDNGHAMPNLHHPYRILHPGQNHSPHLRNPSSSLTSSHNSPNTLSYFAVICKAPLKFLWRKFLQSVFYFRKPEKTEETVLLSSSENDSLTDSEEDYREIPYENAVFLTSQEDSLSNSEEDYREIPCQNVVFVPLPEDSRTKSEDDYREIPCEDTVFVPSPEEINSTRKRRRRRRRRASGSGVISIHDLAYSLSLIIASELGIVKPSNSVQEIRPVAKKPPESKGKGKQREKDVMIEKRTAPLDDGVWIKHYSNCHRILLVGDGDFSFSAALAAAFGCASNMIATSLDSKEFLKENYRMAASNIEKLRKRKCKVMHGIDATKMADHEFLGNLTFDRVIFNFPFAGFFKDLSRASVLRRHRRLVSLFLKNAKEMIDQNGEIHVTHKTNAFHIEWNLESVASSHRLKLIEAVEFNHLDYPGYNTKRGFGGDNNFDCNPSKTYKFGLKRVGY